MYVAEVVIRKYRSKKLFQCDGPDSVWKLRKKLAKFDKEHFEIVLLNARHEVLGVETISIGTLNASLVHPREVFKPAVQASAAAIIMVHNHPSGDPSPSEEDIQLTKRMIKAGEIMGVKILDHVIIGVKGYRSLKNIGHMESDHF